MESKPNWPIIILLLFVFLPNPALEGQDFFNEDSLKAELEKIPEEYDQVDAIISESIRARRSSYPRAISLAHYAQNLAREYEIQELEGDCYNLIGVLFMEQTNKDSAMKYYEEGLAFGEKTDDSVLLAKLYINTGKMHSIIGHFTIANEYGFRALEMSQSQKDSSGMAFCQWTLAENFISLGEYELALPYLKQALSYYQNTQSRSLTSVLNAFGVCHFENGNYDSSLYYFQASLQLKEELGDTRNFGGLKMNMGMVYMAQEKWQKAEAVFRESLALSEQNQMRTDWVNSLINLAASLKGQGKYGEAKRHYEKAYNLSIEFDNSSRRAAASRYLADINAIMGNHVQAYELFREHKHYDSLMFNENSQNRILELEEQYQSAQKDKEIAQKDLLLLEEEEARQRQIWIFSFIGTLALALFLYFYLRNRYQQKLTLEKTLATEQRKRFSAVIEAEETERKRIARELHDGLGQLLSTARMNVSGLDQAVEEGGDETDQHVFKTAIGLIDEATTEVRHVSHNLMPVALTQSGLIPALHTLVDKINTSGKIQVSLQADESEKRLHESKEIALYRIIQEIVNNSLKHAEASEISIHLDSREGQLNLDIKDNGKGMHPDQLTSAEGIGWQNIRSRVELINGRLQVQSAPGKGTHYQLVFTM